MTSSLHNPRWAALFDWDGVIIDSKALHEAAWNQVALEFGYRHGPEDFRRHFGTQNQRAIKEILGWTADRAQIERIAEFKEELYRKQLSGAGNLLLSGAAGFLTLLEEKGVPRAVVSSSPRANIEAVLDGVGLRSTFSSIVTAEEMRRGKPDPEGFLLGAQRLGVPKERCVVFEDAPAGIEAGRRAGMRVIAFTTTHEAAALQDAHLVSDGFTPALLETIEAWF